MGICRGLFWPDCRENCFGYSKFAGAGRAQKEDVVREHGGVCVSLVKVESMQSKCGARVEQVRCLFKACATHMCLEVKHVTFQPRSHHVWFEQMSHFFMLDARAQHVRESLELCTAA